MKCIPTVEACFKSEIVRNSGGMLQMIHLTMSYSSMLLGFMIYVLPKMCVLSTVRKS